MRLFTSADHIDFDSVVMVIDSELTIHMMESIDATIFFFLLRMSFMH